MIVRNAGRVFALLAFAILFAGLRPAGAEESGWLRGESEHFVVYSNGAERNLRDATADLETFDLVLRLLTQTTGPASPNKLEVFLFKDRAQLRQVWPSVPDYIAGFYYADVEQIAAFALFRSGESKDYVLFHEYAHHFMYQYFPGAYPTWYSEGFAEYLASAQVSYGRVSVGEYDEGRVYTLLHEPWLPLTTLLTAKTDDLNAADGAKFYAMAWLMTHYCYSTVERKAMLNAYFARLRKGEDALEAFSLSFNMTPAAFSKELSTYLRSRLAYKTLTGATFNKRADVAITRLPASANDLLLLLARLDHGVEDKDAEQFLATVRAAVAKYPNDDFAVRVMARAEIEMGDPARARTLLEPLVAANDQNADTYYLLGWSYIARGAVERIRTDADFKSARREFVRAFKHDPNHVQTLYKYAMTFWQNQEDMPPNALDAIIAAWDRAPQVDEISFNVAQALMAKDRFAEAADALRPIAFDPHGGGAADEARGLLLEAEKKAAEAAAQP